MNFLLQSVIGKCKFTKVDSVRHIVRCYSPFYGSSRSTIYALATGAVRSALAVIRVSGPNCKDVVSKLGGFHTKLPLERKAVLRKFRDPITADVLDKGILLWFPGPNSYTGEDCCELHVHGGPSVISRVLQALSQVPECRMAEPGEFTKRAFLNGKMDLTEIDGLADLIAAETEMQRVQALRQMEGSLSQIYLNWRDRLSKCLANVEAYIDFGEDDAIESDIMEDVENNVGVLIEDIKRHLGDQRKGQRLREGVRIAILGQPNAGKSTLLNLLSRREAAIVSGIPGTTRDVIESCVNIDGFPVVFADTAGIRSLTLDQIEAEGIRRSIAELSTANIIILLADGAKLKAIRRSQNHKITRRDVMKQQLELDSFEDQTTGSINELETKTVIVLNKLDLVEEEFWKDHFDSAISCKTGDGVEKFQELLVSRIREICGDPLRDAPYVTQERYRSELESCVKSLRSFLQNTEEDSPVSDLALRTNHLKNGLNAIGAITGHVDPEHILDIIFRDFCIGK